MIVGNRRQRSQDTLLGESFGPVEDGLQKPRPEMVVASHDLPATHSRDDNVLQSLLLQGLKREENLDLLYSANTKPLLLRYTQIDLIEDTQGLLESYRGNLVDMREHVLDVVQIPN